MSKNRTDRVLIFFDKNELNKPLKYKKVKMKKITIIRMLLLAGLLSVGVSCADKNTEQKEVIQPVKVFKVNRNTTSSETKIFTGLVKESREVNLAFQIAGPLVELSVDEGQYVRKGELIAILDDRDYQVQLQAANASYENAKLQAERYAALYEKKSTSKSVHDQMQASFKLAKAQKEAAENALKDTKIYAPFSGYIQSKFVENHEKIASGHPIVSLLDLNNLELTVALSENDFLQSNRFDSFSCEFENFPEESFSLKLIDIERKPNGDNFYKMRLGLNRNDKQIVPGMVASVTANLNPDDFKGQKVPIESVFSTNGKSYVWTINESNGVVKKTEVSLGSIDSNGMIDIKVGISNGELIVSAGVHTLREGQKVKEIRKKANSNIGGQL